MQIICDLVGAHFRPAEAKEILKSLSVGDHLTLERDPENQYDQFAVKVMHNDEHLGFIPKTDNYELSRYLDQGGAATAKIVGFVNTFRPTLAIEFGDD